MVQINLLPDVKAKYIKTQRTKRLTLLSSMAVCGVAIVIVVILASVVYGAQKVRLNSLDKDLKANQTKLEQTQDLDKVLTIQNQLNSLTALHDQKPVTSRLFYFLPQITPVNVYMASLNLSYADKTIQISGSCDTLESVNKFVDTLKFTDYSTDKSTDKVRAFSTVVLSSFARTDKDANYSITMSFDPLIFSSEFKTVTLNVPKITSTRSQTEQPTAIFKEQTKPASEGQ